MGRELTDGPNGAPDQEQPKKAFSMSISLTGAGKRKQQFSNLTLRENAGKEEEKELITAITGTEIHSADRRTEEAVPLVIPLTKNPWQRDVVSTEKETHKPRQEKANDEVPETEDQKAARALLEDIREQAEVDGPSKPLLVIKSAGDKNEAGKEAPILIANQVPGLLDIEDETQRLKHDLSHRPEELDVRGAAYQQVPVMQFGEAMLRGMGWAGLKDAGEEQQQTMPRPGRLGLGAVPKPPEAPERKRKRKPGESSKEQEREAQRRRFIEETEKKRRKSKTSSSSSSRVEVGDIIYIRGSSHAGKRAEVVQTEGVPGLDQIRVALERSGKEIAISRREVQLEDAASLEESPFVAGPKDPSGIERAQTKGKFSSEGEERSRKKRDDHSQSSSSKDKRRARSRSREKQREKRPSEPTSSTKQTSDRNSTLVARGSRLCPDIRVRVVTKKLDGGRWYSMKGIVTEVMPGKNVCSVRMEGGKVVHDVKERWLESALPKAGGTVMILRGPRRFTTGRLLERSSSRNEAIVQCFADLSVEKLELDDVAEFVGEVLDES